MKDPIVEEVRKARQDHAKEFNHDLSAICKDLKKARRLFGIKFHHLRVDLYYGTVFFNDNKRIYNFKQIL